jgi:fatty-acyl-CoA synthase
MAAAVGRPDAALGELPVAYVQLRDGAALDPADLMRHCEEHVAERAAVPKFIRVVDELPLTPIGKVFKPALRHAEIEAVVREAVQRIDGIASAQVTVRSDGRQGDVVTVIAAASSPAQAFDVRAGIEGELGAFSFVLDLEVS